MDTVLITRPRCGNRPSLGDFGLSFFNRTSGGSRDEGLRIPHDLSIRSAADGPVTVAVFVWLPDHGDGYFSKCHASAAPGPTRVPTAVQYTLGNC